MSENLKVNANSSVLEHKRKHNLLVERLGATEDGEFKILENIVDSDGNKRFIEGSISNEQSEKVVLDYGKWSLSGSHLMIVFAGHTTEATSFDDYDLFGILQNLPAWVLSKIYPIKAEFVDFKLFNVTYNDWSPETITISLTKEYNSIRIKQNGNKSLTQPTTFRFVFDILIDNA